MYEYLSKEKASITILYDKLVEITTSIHIHSKEPHDLQYSNGIWYFMSLGITLWGHFSWISDQINCHKWQMSPSIGRKPFLHLSSSTLVMKYCQGGQPSRAWRAEAWGPLFKPSLRDEAWLGGRKRKGVGPSWSERVASGVGPTYVDDGSKKAGMPLALFQPPVREPQRISQICTNELFRKAPIRCYPMAPRRDEEHVQIQD